MDGWMEGCVFCVGVGAGGEPCCSVLFKCREKSKPFM